MSRPIDARRRIGLVLAVAVAGLAALGPGCGATDRGAPAAPGPAARKPAEPKRLTYRKRRAVDTSGFYQLAPTIGPWRPEATLDEVAAYWKGPGYRLIGEIDRGLASAPGDDENACNQRLMKALMFGYEGEPARAYAVLADVRKRVEADDNLAEGLLYSVVYLQGVMALRRGENDNCIDCRGEGACILPIAATAVHAKPEGSRAAIGHFTEYLERFPDDFEIRWLLNLAHMTLGEYPDKVDPRYKIALDRFTKSEFDIGRFVDVAHDAGVGRVNVSGGAIMDDFDGDGRLDLVVTDFYPTGPMAYYRNKGDGTFEDRTESAGLAGQLGGLACFQADYDNDGRPDVFVPRGAWLDAPIRPSLLRNVGGRFVDVTKQAGLLDPINGHAACWGDYDNDGHLDLFVAAEKQTNRLYRNKGDGTFEEVAKRAGVAGSGAEFAKGCNWIDFDNDDFPDLFVNHLKGPARLYHNKKDGTFAEVTVPMGINGPEHGFSCWAFDFDNDGWLDLFATCYDRTLADIVKGLIGQPTRSLTGRLFRNLGGKGFEDVTREAGLDGIYATMGSNFGDFDNDGFLDIYLATGEPSLATLVPNRMFRNVGGGRFAEITGSSHTGHLQKGHGVAIGDYDRDGDVDLFVQTGGAIPGDRYHNVLFQNPGQKNRSLTVKLVGKKTNRSAIGARIEAVTAGASPLTVHRHVSTGSSFGANPLEQTIGLGGADRLATLKIHWPTSGTTQVLRDIPAGAVIEITEGVEGYRRVGAATTTAAR